MPKSANVATPPTADTVRVPTSEPKALTCVIVAVTCAVLVVTRLPEASLTCTCGDVVNAEPAAAPSALRDTTNRLAAPANNVIDCVVGAYPLRAYDRMYVVPDVPRRPSVVNAAMPFVVDREVVPIIVAPFETDAVMTDEPAVTVLP